MMYLFPVAENERVGIAGGSGSGKSTLLRLIAMLEKAYIGYIATLRRRYITDSKPYGNLSFSADDVSNPLAVIPPRMNIEAFLLEPYINYGLMDVAAAKDDIRKLDATSRFA